MNPAWLPHLGKVMVDKVIREMFERQIKATVRRTSAGPYFLLEYDWQGQSGAFLVPRNIFASRIVDDAGQIVAKRCYPVQIAREHRRPDDAARIEIGEF